MKPDINRDTLPPYISVRSCSVSRDKHKTNQQTAFLRRCWGMEKHSLKPRLMTFENQPNVFSLIDFWRRGFAPPPKINFLLRPVGAFEIFTPVLKRTRDCC